MGKIYIDGQEYTKTRIGAYPDAKDQIFNNTNTSNITSENTQGALDELDSTIGNLDTIQPNSNTVSIITSIDSKIDTLGSKVKGAAQTVTIFKTFANMETWLKSPSNKGKIGIGKHLYIEAMNVPDYWVAEVLDEIDANTGYYYKISPLETKKIDLSSFTSQFGNSDISSLGNGSITGAINVLNNETSELRTKVTEGKALIATAITEKGLSTDINSDFNVLAKNIEDLVPIQTYQEKTVKLDLSNPSVEVTPDAGYSGLTKVSASVEVQSKSTSITGGTVTITPDAGKVLSSVSYTGPVNKSGTTQLTSGVSTSGNKTILNVPSAGYYTTTSKIGASYSQLGIADVKIDGTRPNKDLTMISIPYNESVTNENGETLPALSTILSEYLPEGFTPTANSKIYLSI